MRKYEVNITMNGATSAVDTVMAPENYTADIVRFDMSAYQVTEVFKKVKNWK